MTKTRSTVVLLALVASVVAVADGEQETVAIGDLDVPVVERLEGEFPVGRWQCWVEERDREL